MRKRHILSLVFLCILLVACSQEKEENDVTDLNWKVPSFAFTNQEGQAFGLKQLQGKVWLANFMFTRCPDICPPITANLANIQESFKKEGVDVQLVSFSVDPEHDKPEQLKSFAEKHHADFSSWNFLTGYSLNEIQQLSKSAFKSEVAKVESSEDIALFNHSSQLYLIDQQGQIRKFYNALQPEVPKIVEDAERLIKE